MSDEKTRRRHRERAWLAGGAGLTAVATIVGASARRSIIQRTTAVEDPYADEDFERLDSDRSYVVTTPDGVPLAVREVGPLDAKVTMVFAHGFCLRMGAFYFQRKRLAEKWQRTYIQGRGGADDATPTYHLAKRRLKTPK